MHMHMHMHIMCMYMCDSAVGTEWFARRAVVAAGAARVTRPTEPRLDRAQLERECSAATCQYPSYDVPEQGFIRTE